MSATTHRALRLLALLEQRTSWSGPELAERLEVSERTVRRDVDRLRELGYPVDSERGLDGGYRLGAGRRLPPLLLDDDEAVALVACLRMGALSGEDSVGEAALRALSKVDRMLPAHLHAVASALDASTITLPTSRPQIDWRLLATLARASRDRVRVRFTYTSRSGNTTERDVEPVRLVTQGRLWYLQAFDRGRDAWRTFRLDRMADAHVTTFGFPERTPPPIRDLDPVGGGGWPCTAEARYAAAPDAVASAVPASYREWLRPDGEGTLVRAGAPGWDELAWHLGWVAQRLGVSVDVAGDGAEAEALRAAFGRLAGRFAATAGCPDRRG